MALKKDEIDIKNYATEMLGKVEADLDNQNLKQVTFRIDARVYEQLCQMAKKKGLSKSSMVRIAVSKLIEEKSLSL